VPAHCSAAGRALLADHDAAALRARFKGVALAPHGPNAVATLEELADRLKQAARLGYAVAEEELEPGLVAVAAPVRRFDGTIVCALNVSGPSYRFGPRLHEAGTEVARTAERLSLTLNGQDVALRS
jgi:DNA-binding IclR family transcriptional regulator